MSYVRQGIVVFPHPKGKTDQFDSDLLILVKKTGYYNFWIGDKHYYFDERIDTSKIENNILFYAYNGGKSKEKEEKKKGKIIVKKKKKK